MLCTGKITGKKINIDCLTQTYHISWVFVMLLCRGLTVVSSILVLCRYRGFHIWLCAPLVNIIHYHYQLESSLGGSASVFFTGWYLEYPWPPATVPLCLTVCCLQSSVALWYTHTLGFNTQILQYESHYQRWPKKEGGDRKWDLELLNVLLIMCSL